MFPLTRIKDKFYFLEENNSDNHYSSRISGFVHLVWDLRDQNKCIILLLFLIALV